MTTTPQRKSAGRITGWYSRLPRRARAGIWLGFVAWILVGLIAFAGLEVPLVSRPEPSPSPRVEDSLVLLVVEGATPSNPAMALVHRAQSSASFVLLPPSTVVEVPGVGARYLSKAVAEAGTAGLTTAVANELQIRVPVYAHLDSAAMAALVDRLGSVTVEVSKTIEIQQGSILKRVFSAGPQVMKGSEFVSYLTYVVEGQSELERLARQDAAWRGLLKGLKSQSELPVETFSSWTGDLSPGASRSFVAALARTSPVQFLSLPVSRVGIPGEQAYDIQPKQLGPIQQQLRDVAVSSDRPGRRIRLLVGADGAVGPTIAKDLIEAGYFIATTGVASVYYAESRVVIAADERDRLQAQAERLLDVVGTGKIALVRNGSSDFDATVVIGRDWAASHGFVQSPASPAPKLKSPTVRSQP